MARAFETCEVNALTSDAELGSHGPQRAAWGSRRALAAGTAMLLCAGAGAGAGALSAHRSGRVRAEGIVEAAETLRFVKPGSNCSKPLEDCREAGCCVTSGFTCWEKDAKSAWCKQDCPYDEGWTCADLTKGRPMEVHSPGTSLYCYAVVFQNKGGKTFIPEADLLVAQEAKGLGIFGCDAYDVFGDVKVPLGGGYDSVQLLDVENDFCKFTREDTGACANTAIHYQAWKAIRKTQKWKDMEWVIKADADAVFIPMRLKGLLAAQKVPEMGIYYENCKGVESGFFGSLEVISARGFAIFADKLEDCKWTLAWDGNPATGWKYGPWGEDKFLQECMDKYGVGKLPLFELTYDGACPADRPEGQEKNKKFVPPCWNSSAPVTHPLKSVRKWMSCYAETTR